MSLKARLHSQNLQLWVSKEDLVALAHHGEALVEVMDLTLTSFGEVEITASFIARVAMLEHLDQSVPPALQEGAQIEMAEGGDATQWRKT